MSETTDLSQYLTMYNIMKFTSLLYSGKKVYNNIKPEFKGEIHAVLSLPDGYKRANWMGPYTHVITRLKLANDGDPRGFGKSESDTVAKMHDINYMLADNYKTESIRVRKIREADERMVSTLKEIQKKGTDVPFNIQQGMRLIQLKMLAEDYGILNKKKFGGNYVKLSESNKRLLNKHKKLLELKGFGFVF